MIGIGSTERTGKNQFNRVAVQLFQAASVAGNRGQLFLYNPGDSGMFYVLQNALTRVAVGVASDAAQHFFGTDILNDPQLPGVVAYLDCSTAMVPHLRAFGRDTLSANVLTGNARLSQHAPGSFSHSSVGGWLGETIIPPGSWFAWSPPEGAGIIGIEARLIEYPNAG